MDRIWKHFNTVRKHRKHVRKYCKAAGIWWQGLTHDLSKYSPTEFWESVKYYQGSRSPIDAAKEDKGYSDAWFHHKGRNKHHYEFWHDNLDRGGVNILMPKKYFIELTCDYLGAARAYLGEDFSYAKEYEWWQKKKSNGLAMNIKIQTMLDIIFSDLKDLEYWVTLNTIRLPPTRKAIDKEVYALFKRDYLQQVYEANK